MAESAGSQTLSRGIRLLEIVAESAEPLSIDDVAARLGVHRSVAYRLIRTLEQHGLLAREGSVRGGQGRLVPGLGLAALAAGVERDLRSAATVELTPAAADLGVTCFLGVHEAGECVTLASVEPPRAVAIVAQRPGAKHPVTLGAPGRAILAELPDADWPARVPAAIKHEVAAVRERGWAESRDEVISGLKAVAVPLGWDPVGKAASVAAIYVGDDRPVEQIATRLHEVAERIRRAMA